MNTELKKLRGKILIAMPHLKDPLFQKSVCYICQQDEEGILGFILNKPMDMQEQHLLLDQGFDIDEKSFETSMLQGGPVHTDRGFVLHATEGKWKNTIKTSSKLFVTTSYEILEAIAKKKILEPYAICLGYAAWTPEQLKTELLENDWLVCDIDPKLLLSLTPEERWYVAMQQLGIQNPTYFVHEGGHA